MLDSPKGVCAGQAGFEYPATSVPFSNSEEHFTVFGWVDVCAHADPEGLLGIGQRWVRLALVRKGRSEGLHVCWSHLFEPRPPSRAR
jgi:hypothetical protein